MTEWNAEEYSRRSALQKTMANAGRLTVDFWRNVYTLNYEVPPLPGGGYKGITEPGVSLWAPQLPAAFLRQHGG